MSARGQRGFAGLKSGPTRGSSAKRSRARALHFHRCCSVLFVIHQHAGHALAGDSQQFGDAALRSPSVVQAHDLVACGFPHARSNSPKKSRLNAATDPASRASHTSMRPSTSSRDQQLYRKDRIPAASSFRCFLFPRHRRRGCDLPPFLLPVCHHPLKPVQSDWSPITATQQWRRGPRWPAKMAPSPPPLT